MEVQLGLILSALTPPATRLISFYRTIQVLCELRVKILVEAPYTDRMVILIGVQTIGTCLLGGGNHDKVILTYSPRRMAA